MGGLSLWHWLIVLVVVVLIFGTKRLRNLGQDLGESVKGFKKGMQDDDTPGNSRPVDSRPAELPDQTLADGSRDAGSQAQRDDPPLPR